MFSRNNKNTFLRIPLCLLILCAGPAFGEHKGTEESLEKIAIEKNLANDPHWLALGHYKKLTFGHYRSRVDDVHFFLAEEGRNNPRDELLATLAAAINPYRGEDNEDPLCRFPARYQWLEEQLPLSTQVRRHPDCSDYKKWRAMIDAHSVALVYASAHLNSPSSMYGHTLLRIDPPDYEKSNTALLSWAVSFGANIPQGENDVLFAYKGIFGGYPGLFNVLPYLDKMKEYSRIENRDLWEYPLNLNPQEVDKLVVHLWELKNINFDYFFFDENCSYQLLELLNIARPGQHVTEGYSTVVIPVDTVRGVVSSGFVSGVAYRPSAFTRLEQKISALSDKQKKLAIQLSGDIAYLDSAEYSAYTDAEKLQVADVAYDYTRYQYRKTAANDQVVQGSYRLLREINTLPKTPIPQQLVPFHPENGHESGAFTLGGGREASENYVDMEVRMSFHDLEDNLQGYMPGSAINMGRFKFRQYESESFQLQQLDVIDIDSLSPRDDFFKPVSWRSSVGFERYRTADKDQGVMQMNGGGGVTYEILDDTLFYALGTGRAEYNEGFDENWQAAVGGASGFLYFSSRGTLHVGADAYEFFNGYQRSKTFFTYHWDLAKDSGIEFSASHHHYDDITFDRVELSWRQYFR